VTRDRSEKAERTTSPDRHAAAYLHSLDLALTGSGSARDPCGQCPLTSNRDYIRATRRKDEKCHYRQSALQRHIAKSRAGQLWPVLQRRLHDRRLA
jgi:hypothetical protein